MRCSSRLWYAVSLLAVVLGGVAARSEAATPSRPNVLFILTDDQRWDTMSFMRHPVLKTPNLDRLRQEGTHFTNAFVTISLCSPSRACYLTGTYAHTNGVFGNNHSEFDPKVTPSFPLVLQQAGYETAFLGKWHMAAHANPRPGFDYWLSFKGQGVYNNPNLNENGREFQAQGYITDILTDKALEFLKKPRTKPFCLYLSHKAVHGPFTPAERHKNLFNNVDLPKPPNFDDSLAGKPKWQRAAAVGQGEKAGQKGKGKKKGAAGDAEASVPDELPPREFNPRLENQLNYYRAVVAIDEGIGRIYQLLAQQKQLDNTIIVFAGDNGYFHGEHRRGDKRLMYEEALRVPLLMRYPPLAKAGSTVSQMVLNIDVAPTLLDLAGVEVPQGMQGRSVRPLLEGNGDGWRASFLYEYWVDMTPSIPRMVGVRTSDWKLVRYPDIRDLDELYNLKSDSYELTNLAANPAHAEKLAQMRAELDRLMKETTYRDSPKSPSQTRVDKGREPVLKYVFGDSSKATAVDLSANKLNGQVAKAAPVKDGDRGALQFDGHASIALARSEKLNPANSNWSVLVELKAAADGVVLAQGGKSLGYILFVENGKPCFGVQDGQRLTTARAETSILGRWSRLAAVIDSSHIRLYVDGKPTAEAALPAAIGNLPNDGLSIGADLRSPVDERLAAKAFRGLISGVTIYARALGADELP